MTQGLLRHTIAILFLIIAMTDFMVPCCAFGTDEDDTVSITASHSQAQVQLPTESRGSHKHNGTCDQCYCCSHFPSGPSTLRLPVSLAVVDQKSPAIEIAPLAAPARGLDHPPRNTSVLI